MGGGGGGYFSKSNRRFRSLFHDASFTMPRVLKCVRIAMPLQLIFQNLHINCGSVVFLGCCNIDLALLVVPGQVRPTCSARVISSIYESSFITDTKSFN